MRIQIVAISIMASLFLWIFAYYCLQTTYRTGQAYGVMPNLNISKRLSIFD
ncbi:hypothetical protein F4695_002680 [Rhizobium soli]|jgi:hypothetical protein|uniref:Uncharacterized protein n=1 Tax=Rhizobium soli TaxID=424798 RepID=A0A7X0JKL1_9HYPH|nr:hypothetical protein [Rhizobium sp. NFR12]MBB6509323.1 hypothetical protein [Rhizobium soli]MBP2460756.1 hypothetical protein [Rhizobium sp. PvP014]MBP2528153.1 hypothetical protein [Rhizobium sp. PvP099]SEH24503.1 hypothetical protein SAMN03159407_2324 [Rhizobium sp. NFR12]